MFGSAIIIYVFLGLFFVFCNSQHQPGYVNLAKPNVKKGLKCYDCNSEYDPRCGDPFKNTSIAEVNCTDRRPPDQLKSDLEPVVCRKIIQKVEGKTRVIRGCGYIRDDHDDKKCFRRTGTSAVEVIYCSCTGPDLCNTGHSILRPTFRIITITISITLAITSSLNRFSF